MQHPQGWIGRSRTRPNKPSRSTGPTKVFGLDSLPTHYLLPSNGAYLRLTPADLVRVAFGGCRVLLLHRALMLVPDGAPLCALDGALAGTADHFVRVCGSIACRANTSFTAHCRCTSNGRVELEGSSLGEPFVYDRSEDRNAVGLIDALMQGYRTLDIATAQPVCNLTTSRYNSWSCRRTGGTRPSLGSVDGKTLVRSSGMFGSREVSESE